MSHINWIAGLTHRCALVLSIVLNPVFTPDASASLVQIRDDAGGMGSDGAVNGFYLAGTGSEINGTLNGGVFETLGVGTFAAQINAGDGWNQLLTYCIEPGQAVGYGLLSSDTVGLAFEVLDITNVGYSAIEKQYIEILWAHAYADSMTSAVKSAAFQVVIWELRIDEPDIFFTADNFALNFNQAYTLEVILQAREWMDNILDGIWTDHIDLVALQSDASQDFLVPLTAVPGPATAVILLISFARRSRRR